MQIRVPLKIAVKSRDVVVDIQKRVSTAAITVSVCLTQTKCSLAQAEISVQDIVRE